MYSHLKRLPGALSKQRKVEKWLDSFLNLSSNEYTIKDKWWIYKLGKEPDRCICGNIVHFDGTNNFKKHCSLECAKANNKGRKGMGVPIPLPIEELFDLCWDCNFKAQTVAKALGTTGIIVRRWFRENGIYAMRDARNAKWREFILNNIRLNRFQIAKILNSTPSRISIFCEKQGIDLIDAVAEKRAWVKKTLDANAHLFKDHTLQEISQITGVHYERVKQYRKKHDFPYVIKGKPYSVKEKEIEIFVRQYFPTAGSRKYTINGKVWEVDIMIPDLSLGIEFNGIYWHDSFHGDKAYHQKKTDAFETAGVQILHIWENDWEYKKEIVKSIIASKLGITERLYARKCHVGIIENFTADEFFETCHLKGSGKSGITYGLWHNGELVMCMRFARHKEYQWELLRMASRLNTTVVGGMSKLLKAFIKDNEATSIMSYVDRDISDGKSYYACGFDLISRTAPSYWYVDKYGEVQHRHKFQRQIIKANEAEFAKTMRLRRIHNSGNLKMVYTIKHQELEHSNETS